MMMRVDLALKFLCLAKSRSSVKTLCEGNAIMVNSHPAKASSTVRAGDRISIDYPARTLTVELLDVPVKQLSKTIAPEYYRVVDNH